MRIKYYVLRIAISIFGALCTVHCAQAQIRLSSEAYISLITCSPGKALYEAFGHSAFRVYDPKNKIDVTFNYGTFDFDRPGFYSDYAKGRPVFMLSIEQTRHFIKAYATDNRSVGEDMLNLTPEQNQTLFDLLQENYQPENRQYVYDYIYDNCSTRLRDLVAKLLDGNVVFDSSHIIKSYSFRQLMDLNLAPQPWGDFGIDLALGSEIDKRATPYQYMFLPGFLQAGFRNAKILSGGTSFPLVKNSRLIFKANPEEPEKSVVTPANIFWLVFFLFLLMTIVGWRKERISFIPDLIFFFLLGLVGIALTHISFFSDHHAKGNFNLLWAMPTHLLFAVLLPFRKLTFVKYYFLFAALAAIAAWLGGLTIFPQAMHFAIIPIILTIAIRGTLIFLKRRSY